jgi:hypothetical protein
LFVFKLCYEPHFYVRHPTVSSFIIVFAKSSNSTFQISQNLSHFLTDIISVFEGFVVGKREWGDFSGSHSPQGSLMIISNIVCVTPSPPFSLPPLPSFSFLSLSMILAAADASTPSSG